MAATIIWFLHGTRSGSILRNSRIKRSCNSVHGLPTSLRNKRNDKKKRYKRKRRTFHQQYGNILVPNIFNIATNSSQYHLIPTRGFQLQTPICSDNSNHAKRSVLSILDILDTSNI